MMDTDASPPDSLHAMQQLGDYKLVQPLAIGAAIERYTALHLPSQRRVQIDYLPRLAQSGALERVLARQAALKAAEHPNLLPLLDYGLAAGGLYMVRPPIVVADLWEVLNGAPPDPDTLVCWLVQWIGARRYLYETLDGMLQDNLSPERIVFDRYGNLYLSDLGLPLPMDFHLLAPEAWRVMPSESMTAAAAGYSFGALLYWLMLGRPPFEVGTGGGLDDLRWLHQHAALPRFPQSLQTEPINAALEMSIAALLKKDPKQRANPFEQERHLAAELLQIQSEHQSNKTNHRPKAARLNSPAWPTPQLTQAMQTSPQPILAFYAHANGLYALSQNALLRGDAQNLRFENIFKLDYAACCIAMNERYYLIGDTDGLLYCYDRQTKRPRWESNAHTGKLRFISLQEGRVISGGADGILAQWDLITGVRQSAVALPTADLRAGVSCAPSVVIIGNREGRVQAWDVASGDCLLTYADRDYPVMDCILCGDLVIAAFSDGAILSWDVETGAAGVVFQSEVDDLRGLLPHPREPWVLAWGSGGEVQKFDFTSNQGASWPASALPLPKLLGVAWLDEQNLIGIQGAPSRLFKLAFDW